MRSRECALHHGGRRELAQALDLRAALAFAQCGNGCRWFRRWRPLDDRQHVVARDEAVGPGSAYGAEVDAQVAGEGTNRRRGAWSFADGGFDGFGGHIPPPCPSLWPPIAFGCCAVADEHGLTPLGRLTRIRLGSCHCSIRFPGVGSRSVIRFGAFYLERHNRLADVYHDARWLVKFGNDTGERGRQLDDSLRGLDVGNVLVEFDRVARSNVPGHDLRLREAFTEIGELEYLDHGQRPIARSMPSRIRSRSGTW